MIANNRIRLIDCLPAETSLSKIRGGVLSFAAEKNFCGQFRHKSRL